MAGSTQAEIRRSQYLLGLSSEAERERLESEYFADEDAFQEMLTAEDDLIDAYVRNELSANERRRFEERFLTSPQARERVQFARTLAGTPARKIKREVGGSTWWSGFFASLWANATPLRAGAVMAVLALLVGFSWLLVERSRMNNELRELRAERAQLNERAQALQRNVDSERARNAETLAQLEDLRRRSESDLKPQQRQPLSVEQVTKNNQRERKPPIRNSDATRGDTFAINNPNRSTGAFDLSPGSVRAGGGNTLRVSATARFIVLRLTLDTTPSHETYSASIETPGGQTVWRRDEFNPFSKQSVVTGSERVEVPAKDLPAGDYILFLTGKRPDGTFERVAEYSFRVLKN